MVEIEKVVSFLYEVGQPILDMANEVKMKTQQWKLAERELAEARKELFDLVSRHYSTIELGEAFKKYERS